jgi:hypothetical protein
MATCGRGWTYVAPGDDPPEWVMLESDDIRPLRSLFVEKLTSAAMFGRRLWWETGEVGGEFLVFSNSRVVFNPDTHRVTLGSRTTDVPWYLSRILPLFRREDGVVVES